MLRKNMKLFAVAALVAGFLAGTSLYARQPVPQGMPGGGMMGRQDVPGGMMGQGGMMNMMGQMNEMMQACTNMMQAMTNQGSGRPDEQGRQPVPPPGNG